MIKLTFKILDKQVRFELQDSESTDYPHLWKWVGKRKLYDFSDITALMIHYIKKWEEGERQPLLEKFRNWEELPKEEKIDFIKNDIKKQLSLFQPLPF